MRYVLSLATICLLVAPAYAGPHHANKDPFGTEGLELRQARKAEMRDREEREERAHDVQRQREIDHPEMYQDERPQEDLEQ